MSELNRRGFLAGVGAAGLTALAAGGIAAAAEFSEAKAAAPAARTGTIKDVKHVVMLMQENRSFDHYYGTMRGVRGFSDRSAIEIRGGTTVFDQPDGRKRQYPFAQDVGYSHKQVQHQRGLPHEWDTQHAAWDHGRLDDWVRAKGVDCMGYLTRADHPFHFALADAYTICDAYHASALSSTGPNRTYFFSGTIDAARKYVRHPPYTGPNAMGQRLPWQTYAEALQAAGVSWRVYQGVDNFKANALEYFANFDHIDPHSALARNGLRRVPSKNGSVVDGIVAALEADVRAGTLPQVSWIVTDKINSEHPVGPTANGERLIHDLMHALNADPKVFDSTVLFINYDENDGYFDHVPPPTPKRGTAGEFYDGSPVGLGFRVPMTIISPWSRGGFVDSQVFDHTSVLQFLETWTKAIGTPAICRNISDWRRAVCGDLTSAFDFAAPIFGMPSLPAPRPTELSGGHGIKIRPKTDARPTQEPGTRPARSLPYQPNSWATGLRHGASSNRIEVSLANVGSTATSAAHFAVYAGDPAGPRQHTVAPGMTTTDAVEVGAKHGGRYDITVIGPNRFLRRLTGRVDGAARGVEVATRIEPVTGAPKKLLLDLTNDSRRAATLTVTSTNYRSDGPWRYHLTAGAKTTISFNTVADQHGWYDFTITCPTDPSWTRRVVGHIETGQASVSG